MCLIMPGLAALPAAAGEPGDAPALARELQIASQAAPVEPAALVLSSTPASGEALGDAREIVRRSLIARHYQGVTMDMEFSLSSADANGRVSNHVLRLRRRTIASSDAEISAFLPDQDYLLDFLAPSSVRGMRVSVRHRPRTGDVRKDSLPGLNLNLGLSAGDRRVSLFGTQLSYEDLFGGPRLADHDQTLEAVTDEDYVVRLRPVSGSPEGGYPTPPVEYAALVLTVDRSTFLPKSQVYLDALGREMRRIETVRVEVIDGYPVASRLEVTSSSRERSTLQLRRARFDVSSSGDEFVVDL